MNLYQTRAISSTGFDMGTNNDEQCVFGIKRARAVKGDNVHMQNVYELTKQLIFTAV